MTTSAERIKSIIKKYRDMEEGIYSEAPAQLNPEEIALFGGVCGLPLSVPEFTVCNGLVIRRSFAHVMAPYVLAFAPPLRKGAPHPAPWKAANGGLGFDVTVEIGIARECRPVGFSRMNTLWWLLALLRLRTGAALRMPVISNTAFKLVPKTDTEPVLWTIEMPPHQLRAVRTPPPAITSEHLDWLRDSFIKGAGLMDIEHFNRAVQTFDGAIWAHSFGSAIIMIWAALETLFRPGRQQVTKTLSICIATFLCPAGPNRDRLFQRVQQLYETRGTAAHDAQTPEFEHLLESFDIARSCLIMCIDNAQVPDAAILVTQWRARR